MFSFILGCLAAYLFLSRKERRGRFTPQSVYAERQRHGYDALSLWEKAFFPFVMQAVRRRILRAKRDGETYVIAALPDTSSRVDEALIEKLVQAGFEKLPWHRHGIWLTDDSEARQRVTLARRGY